MSTRYLYSLASQPNEKETLGGLRKKATKDHFPILNGLSLYYLELNPGGVREPHWHVNAHELCYCIEGKVAMTIFSPGGNHDTFQISPGEIAFVPKGYIHHIENITDQKATLAVGFNHENPEELELSTVFSAAGPSIMSATFDVDASYFSKFPVQEKEMVITKKASNEFLGTLSKANRHVFQLQSIDPQVDVKGGTIALSHKENFDILDGITLFDLRLNVGGVREPHWHPNAAELDYAVSGRARMLIMAPDGSKEVFEVKKGDVVFIPSAYYHYIENIGDEEMHFAVFFNHESPEDLGISGSMGAYNTNVLSAVLQVPPSVVEPLTHYRDDVFIGPRLLKQYVGSDKI